MKLPAIVISIMTISLFIHCKTALPIWMTSIQKTEKVAPAIILMIGDGMGLNQVSAAMYSQQAPLAIESFPVIGFQKTHSSSNLTTDSAAAATAFACGIKTYNNAIGVNSDTIACQSILKQAAANGLSTGIIVTSALVHATPASFVAHQPHRIFYEQIAEEMAYAGVDLLIGGGKKYFDRREDDQNLIALMKDEGYVVADYFHHNLRKIIPDVHKKFVYFTADKEPLPASQGRSYLAYASRMGCHFLQQKSKENGFFMLIEGSQIDWANHANLGELLIQETLDFDRAVAEVLSFAKKRGNTLVIVTADHESGGLAIQNDSKRGKLTTTFTTNGHTATMVPVYAYGAGAEDFAGIYENTVIYDRMKHFLGLE